MNIVKHMEAVFVVALAALGSASYLAAPVSDARARAAIQDSSIATETKMAVVVVKGKRPAQVLLAARGNGAARV